MYTIRDHDTTVGVVCRPRRAPIRPAERTFCIACHKVLVKLSLMSQTITDFSADYQPGSINMTDLSVSFRGDKADEAQSGKRRLTGAL